MSRRLQADGLQWLTKQPTFPDRRASGRSTCVRPARGRSGLDTRTLSDECSIILFCQKSKGWRLPGQLKLRFTVKHPQRHNVRIYFGYGGHGHIRCFTENLAGLMARILEEDIVPCGEGTFGLSAGQWVLMHDRDPKDIPHLAKERGPNLGLLQWSNWPPRHASPIKST